MSWGAWEALAGGVVAACSVAALALSIVTNVRQRRDGQARDRLYQRLVSATESMDRMKADARAEKLRSSLVAFVRLREDVQRAEGIAIVTYKTCVFVENRGRQDVDRLTVVTFLSTAGEVEKVGTIERGLLPGRWSGGSDAVRVATLPVRLDLGEDDDVHIRVELSWGDGGDSERAVRELRRYDDD